MLLNLSNHPTETWTPDQVDAALSEFGKVVYEPFPNIPPEYSGKEVYELALKYLNLCQDILKDTPSGSAVMLSGETTFCAALSHMLLDAGYRVVCATTRRVNVDLGNGQFLKSFKFVGFRDYIKL
ncbi:MAG: hypothetical protein IJ940_02735 [Bacteroidales bacterium]|nr:hypothetical protein [Bacteroidales bacterium]